MTDGMDFTSIVENFETALWQYHIKVPSPIADAFLENGTRRVVCQLNQRVEFQCAILPNGADTYFILLNKKIREQLKLSLGSAVEVRLAKDESEYGLPMPPEFREVLDIEPEADAIFHRLTPGKQRSLLHLIGTVKNTDSRIRRSLAVAHHLRHTDGKIDFKLLNEHLKMAMRDEL